MKTLIVSIPRVLSHLMSYRLLPEVANIFKNYFQIILCVEHNMQRVYVWVSHPVLFVPLRHRNKRCFVKYKKQKQKNHLLQELRGLLGGSFLRLVIDIRYSKADLVAFCPFEVVQKT